MSPALWPPQSLSQRLGELPEVTGEASCRWPFGQGLDVCQGRLPVSGDTGQQRTCSAVLWERGTQTDGGWGASRVSVILSPCGPVGFLSRGHPDVELGGAVRGM